MDNPRDGHWACRRRDALQKREAVALCQCIGTALPSICHGRGDAQSPNEFKKCEAAVATAKFPLVNNRLHVKFGVCACVYVCVCVCVRTRVRACMGVRVRVRVRFGT
jgi:hypothetical protein